MNWNHGPQFSFLCSLRGGRGSHEQVLEQVSVRGVSGDRPVKIKHTRFMTPEANACLKTSSITARFARTVLVLLLALVPIGIFAQQPQTIDQIRVIGNRRIPKETVLARLFTHVGDTYDPVSIERDFNSLWNTGYFEDLRIEREDTEKGIILERLRP